MPCLTSSRPRVGSPYARENVKTATKEDEIIDWSLEAVTPEYFGEIEKRHHKELGHQGEVRPQVAPIPHR